MKPTINTMQLMPKVLPTVHILEHCYFVDLRLHQFRNVENPHDSIDFASSEGKRMCMQSGVITCPRCGTSTIVPTMLLHAPLHCVSCGSPIW